MIQNFNVRDNLDREGIYTCSIIGACSYSSVHAVIQYNARRIVHYPQNYGT